MRNSIIGKPEQKRGQVKSILIAENLKCSSCTKQCRCTCLEFLINFRSTNFVIFLMEAEDFFFFFSSPVRLFSLLITYRQYCLLFSLIFFFISCQNDVLLGCN